MFSEKFKNIRARKKLTMPMVAFGVHISERTLWRYEQGQSTPSLKTLKKLAEFFHVSESYFLQ